MTGSSRDEGVVKYQAFHQNANAPEYPLLNQLDEVRTRLFDLGLVGVYPDGIGYGNVSVRYETGCIISGTATGGVRILGPSGYCYVKSFNLQKNIVYTEGPINASSESMTHCAIYQANPLVQCVLHIHARELWERLICQGCESTSADIPYGTPEMAFSVSNLVRAQLQSSKLIVMAGHEEGVVAYGKDILSAFNQIQAVLNN